MFPHGHFAVGYLLLSGTTRIAWGRSPNRKTILLVISGTQLSDLIDKPLSLLIGGPFATGRTIGHSILFSIPVLLCLGLVSRDQQERRLLVVAFAVSYLSHPFVDASIFVLQGTVVRDIAEVSFVVWPVVLPADDIVDFFSQSAIIQQLIISKPLWTAQHLPSGVHLKPYIRAVEIILASLAVITWLDDDAPGLNTIRNRVERIYRASKYK